MNKMTSRLLLSLVCGVSLCATVGCASSGSSSSASATGGSGSAAPAGRSGFLPDYSRLEKVKTDKGTELERWVSPTFTKANYQKVLIEDVIFYPTPQPSAQVSNQTLMDIQNYLTQSLRSTLAPIPQVTQPGPGVVRVKVAITAVDTSMSGLKPWDVIPVALVVNGAMAATGTRSRAADLNVEALATDSVTGEPLVMSVRKTEGVTVPNSSTQVTLDTVKSRIDQWSANASEAVIARLK